MRTTRNLLLIGAALAVFSACGRLRERVVFTWIDASGSFSYDQEGKKHVAYRAEAKRDILEGLKRFFKDDLLASLGVTRYRLIIGTITGEINSKYDVVFDGKISSKDMREVAEILNKVEGNLPEAGRHHKTDIFGSFRVMEAMLKRSDPGMKSKPYYAIYYSDMQDTKSWVDDGTPMGRRETPDLADFEYLKHVRFYAVFADPAAPDEYGSLKTVTDWLGGLHARSGGKTRLDIRFVPPAEYKSIPKGKTAWHNSVKNDW